MSEKPMHIITLEVENFKRISTAFIKPEGKLVKIIGKNGAGKSSALDAIESLLGGKEAFPAVPVKRGAKQSVLSADLGDMTLRRTIKTDGVQKVELVSKEGATLKSPQALLDTFYNKHACDPMKFMSLKPKEKRDIVSKMSGVNPDEFSAKKLTIHTKRTEVNRMAKQAASAVETKKSALDQAMKVAKLDKAPEAPVVVADLMDEMAKMENENNSVAYQIQRAERMAMELENFKGKVAACESEIVIAEKKLAALKDEKEKRVKALEAATVETDGVQANAATLKKHDLGEIKAKILDAGTVNACHRINAELLDAIQTANNCESTAEKMTSQIEAIDTAFAEAVSKAKMPIPELGFSDDGVIYKGVPLEQASAAEQLRVSAAIAMSGEQRLRILIVRDASLLDDDSMALLAEVAQERDYQIWIERVSGHGETGVLFVNGEIAPTEKANDSV